ncbi:MAG: mucoidy inhibitor MuiA family protein [Phycisphaerales bacterium]
MLALIPFVLAIALADDPVVVESKVVPVSAAPSAVTLYQGTAAVTRSTPLPQSPGVYELRFANLPESVLPDSLQAKVAPPAKLLDVRYEEVVTPKPETANNPELAKLQQELDSIRLKRRDLAAKHELLQGQLKALDAVIARLAQGGGREGGAELDPTKLKAQLDFVAHERETAIMADVALEESKRKLDEDETALKARVAALGGAERRTRTGVVVLALSESGATGEASLIYSVRDATWRPSYALRAASDLSGLDVEYDASVMQRTGESWKDVALTLSTAQPSRSASPAALDPIYVRKSYPVESGFAGSVSAPAVREPGGGGRLPGKRKADQADRDAGGESKEAELAKQVAGDAVIEQNATVATFALPRAVTFPSDASREQRTRIATIPLKPEYVYVARPAVDPDVYLRGKTRNDSAYQLLSGRATVFLGNDSVGSAVLPDVAPGADVELWFGPDRRIASKRVIVSRNQSESGLISKESVVALQYKIELTNSVPKPVKVELWDRIPVSQDEGITVKLADVQPPLAKDPEYESKERKQGLLKWLLELPARPAERSPETIAVRWNVTVSWPKDAPIVWFPE